MKLILFLSFVAEVFTYGCQSKPSNEITIQNSGTSVIRTKVVKTNDDTTQAILTPIIVSRPVYDSFNVKKFIYHNLSDQCDIMVNTKRFISKDDVGDSSIVKAVLKDKFSHVNLDSVLVTSTLYFSDYFQNGDNIRSYSTGVNSQKQILDNYFGDLVVADLNFDGKDDIAIISDMGGNSGPLYNFFIQTKNNKFVLDKYLTDSMEFFPTTLNKKAKTLTTYGHAGVMWVGRHIYKFNPETNSWKLISFVTLGPRRKSGN